MNGKVRAYDSNLRTLVEGELPRRNQAALDARYLGNNSECATDPAPYVDYTASPTISTILGYRTVKHTVLIEPAPCSGN